MAEPCIFSVAEDKAQFAKGRPLRLILLLVRLTPRRRREPFFLRFSRPARFTASNYGMRPSLSNYSPSYNTKLASVGPRITKVLNLHAQLLGRDCGLGIGHIVEPAWERTERRIELHGIPLEERVYLNPACVSGK